MLTSKKPSCPLGLFGLKSFHGFAILARWEDGTFHGFAILARWEDGTFHGFAILARWEDGTYCMSSVLFAHKNGSSEYFAKSHIKHDQTPQKH